MEKLSEIAWLYVKGRPMLVEGLGYGVINHSALARMVCRELGVSRGRTNAVKAALIRIAERLRKKELAVEKGIFSVLEGSSISIQTKIAVVVSRRELGLRAISHAKSGDYITYMVERGELGKIKREKGIRLVHDDLNLITIKSREELEETPGVIAFILSALAHEGINVVEFISCYTDTIIAIRESDTAKAYELLSSILG